MPLDPLPYDKHLTDTLDALADRGWAVDHTLFDADLIAALRASCEARWQAGAFHAAAVGRAVNEARREDIRSDAVLWLDESDSDPAVAAYFQRMDAVRQAVNQTLYLGLAELETHFATYPEGAFYKKHLDRFRDDDARTLTAVLYLNPDWPADAGGQMRLYLDEACTQHLDIPPEAGTLVLFLSDRFWHEVLPTHQPRMAVTGWFRRRIGPMPW